MVKQLYPSIFQENRNNFDTQRFNICERIIEENYSKRFVITIYIQENEGRNIFFKHIFFDYFINTFFTLLLYSVSSVFLKQLVFVRFLYQLDGVAPIRWDVNSYRV